MYESANSVQLLPWGEEGIFDLFKLRGKVVNKLFKVGDIGNESNGDSKVAVMIFFVEGSDGFTLDQEVIGSDPWSALFH